MSAPFPSAPVSAPANAPVIPPVITRITLEVVTRTAGDLATALAWVGKP